MPGRAPQSTNFVLTFNGLDRVNDERWAFDPEQDFQPLPQHPDEVYVIWALECGESGNLHIQAQLSLGKRRTTTAVAGWFAGEWGVHPHVEVAHDVMAARKYVDKPGNEEHDDGTNVAGPWSRGDPGRHGQGARNDLNDAVAVLKETRNLKRVAEEYPMVYVRAHKGLKELQGILGLHEEPRDPDFVPRPWQARVIYMLSKPANDRIIFWVKDTVGNKGKSRLTKYLRCEKGARVLDGKWDNMAFLWPKEGAPIAVFDVPRGGFDKITHYFAFAEKLKDGFLNSGKYECVPKAFDAPHVIFFSNQLPPDGVFSADRLRVVDLDESRWHTPFTTQPVAVTDPPANPPGPAPGAYGSDHAAQVEEAAAPVPVDPFLAGFL